MKNEEREQLIDLLIENCECWTPEDKELLNGLSDEKLEQLANCVSYESVYNAVVTGVTTDSVKFKLDPEKGEWLVENLSSGNEPTNNQESKEGQEDDFDKWLEQVPPKIRATIETSMRVLEDQKKALQDQVLTNTEKPLRERVQKIVSSMSIEDLQALIEGLRIGRKADYSGRFHPVNNNEPNNEPEEVLPYPEIEWSATN